MASPPAKPPASRLVTAKITVILVVTLWAFAITAVLRGRLAYDGAPEARELADPPAAAEPARPREPPAAVLLEQRARGDEAPDARPAAAERQDGDGEPGGETDGDAGADGADGAGAGAPVQEPTEGEGEEEPPGAPVKAPSAGAASPRSHRLANAKLGGRVNRLRLLVPSSPQATGAALMCVPAKTASTSLWQSLYMAYSGGVPWKSCAGPSHRGGGVHSLSGCGWEKYIRQPVAELRGMETVDRLLEDMGRRVYKLAIAREPLARAWSSYKSKVRARATATGPERPPPEPEPVSRRRT